MNPQRILVLGAGDVGSAVAHRLFMYGADVVLADIPAPAHTRRGMAFTDAWFDGTATLEGVVALLVAEANDLDAQLTVMDAIPCTSAPPARAAAELRPHALVDARMRKRSVPEDLRALAPVVVGLGPGFTPGSNCTLAIETAWGDRLGKVLSQESASQLAGEPRALDGVGRERFVYTQAAGLWQTQARIGDTVSAGMLVGTLNGQPLLAPLVGALRGLSHDGVAVQAGQKLVEIDPRVQPDTHGLGARPSTIARGVGLALGFSSGLDNAFFGFEADFRATLGCIPMSMRFKLDCCGIKLSLEQWRAVPQPLRETLLEAPADSPRHVARMAQFLRRRGQQMGWPELPPVKAGDAVPDTLGAIPQVVSARCAARGQPPLSADSWAKLTPLQRYALVKLAGNRSGRNWREALVEFGVRQVTR